MACGARLGSALLRERFAKALVVVRNGVEERSRMARPKRAKSCLDFLQGQTIEFAKRARKLVAEGPQRISRRRLGSCGRLMRAS